MPFFASAGKLKKVVVKGETGTEIYYVLKSDKQIKQGSYQKFNLDNNLDISGFYKHGLMDSVWTEFNSLEKIMSKGKYHLGNKAGIWEYYTIDGNLEQKYDFDKKEL